MRIEQLLLLADVAQTKSMSKTARKFFMTQQGVSHSIKTLETEFDLKLLRRTKYGVLLTPIGEVFVEKSKEIISLYHEMVEQAEIFHNAKVATLKGKLVVMSHPRVYQHILPSIIQSFSTQCPHVDLHVLENQSSHILNNVISGDADLGIITISSRLYSNDEFEQILLNNQLALNRLFVDDIVACVSHTSPWKGKSSFRSEELTNLPIVTYDYDSIADSRLWPARNQGSIFTSNNIEVHKNLVKKGLAIDVMSSFEFKKIYGDDPVIVPIPIQKEKIITALLTKSTTKLSPPAEYFTKLLTNFNYYS